MSTSYYELLCSPDPSLYQISKDESEFLKKCTGINDDEELKQHILKVQAEAFTVFSYPCLRRFAFIDSSLPKNADYPAVLDLAESRENAIFLDVGCGFGNDARKAISDGFPLQNVLCSDLRKGFFNLSHKLYQTTPEIFPLAFFEGDIFETGFSDEVDSETDDLAAPVPNLHALKNLGQLKHKISVINASAFFHLFENEKQRELAVIVGNLLSPQPGSIILGSQSGGLELRTRESPVEPGKILTLHSPETWQELWIGPGGPFKQNEVEIRAQARPFAVERLLGITFPPGGETHKAYRLSWSVRRL